MGRTLAPANAGIPESMTYHTKKAARGCFPC